MQSYSAAAALLLRLAMRLILRAAVFLWMTPLLLADVDGRDSNLNDGLLVSSIAVDDSVCLLDHCFQVGLDDLVVQSLFLG